MGTRKPIFYAESSDISSTKISSSSLSLAKHKKMVLVEQKLLRHKKSNRYLVRASNTTTRQQQIQVEIDKPVGLRLRQSRAPNGGLEVARSTGNAAKAGI